jgi:hypothetical protein
MRGEVRMQMFAAFSFLDWRDGWHQRRGERAPAILRSFVKKFGSQRASNAEEALRSRMRFM